MKLKKLLTKVISLSGGFFLAYVAIELTAILTLAVFNSSTPNLSRIRANMTLVLENYQDYSLFKREVLNVPYNMKLHPYFGGGFPAGLREIKINQENKDIDSAKFVIGLTGGSVAQHLFQDQREYITEKLQGIPKLNGKNISLKLFANGTWKQPQQLIAVNYYLILGGKLDLLINLDGHNEIVDAAINYKNGRFFAYPLLWYYLSANSIPPELLRDIGKLTFAKGLRYELAKNLQALDFSVFFCGLWELLDISIDRYIGQRLNNLSEHEELNNQKLPFYRTGPRNNFKSTAELYKEAAKVWLNGSLLLSNLAKQNGFSYFHFLQPNQYVPYSKQFTEEELMHFFDKSRTDIRDGYPYLLSNSKILTDQGVSFKDITSVFKNVNETVYKDNCCHLNILGNRLLAESIADTIIRELAE